MAQRRSLIAIRFKEIPAALMRETGLDQSVPNSLLLRIQPDEGIALEFEAKRPGPAMKLGEVRMNFKYEDYFGTAPATIMRVR